jgi:Rieske Fe-S protein
MQHEQPNRRDIVVAGIVGATITAACGCSGGGGASGGEPGRASPNAAGPFAAGPFDAGPITDFSSDGIYNQFAESHEFFVIRLGNRLFAMTAICTHRRCALKRRENIIRCRCHGSTFTAEGNVTRGPATRDLPRFAVERSPENHLIVHLDRRLPAGTSDSNAVLLVA